MNSILNIALLAHVDAGKTSLTEQILFHSGEIKSVGLVDKGQSVSDVLNVEKQRGISVMSSQMNFQIGERKVNIIDTPGHADFISEVERSLIAVDLVLLIVSAYEGVQAQTRNIWKVLKKKNIPVLLVVNKIDREGFDEEELVNNIKEELDESVFAIQKVNENVISTLREDGFSGYPDLLEQLVEADESLMEKYLSDEEIEETLLWNQFYNSWKESFTPIVFTSAKQGLGLDHLLDELKYYPSNFDKNTDFSARVYKISHDQQFGKLVHLKIDSGTIKRKDLVYLPSSKKEEKINLIKQVFSDKMIDMEEAFAGDIVAVTGLQSVEIGDRVGEQEEHLSSQIHSDALLNVRVKHKDAQDYIPLSEALQKLNLEDPALDFNWYPEEEEFLIKVNGKIQIEILRQLIFDRFQIDVEFDEPEVIYKETPLKEAIGFEAYTMPKPCWAVVKFLIEPAERGSGISYQSKVGVNKIHQKYQNEVERTISKALKQGIKGWEVTDLKITLVEGEHHVVHSRPGDFILATPMAIMNGLKEAGSQLLEPILKYRIEAPESSLGVITSEILNLRGNFEQPEFLDDKFILEAYIPVATSIDFPVFLAANTSGQAIVSATFHSYENVDDENAKTRDFKGISPLERSKYILQWRGAIK